MASDSFDTRAAAPGTLPTRVPPAFGRAVYGLLDRVAPAPYVETTLASDALERGDVAAALVHALRLPASPWRDVLLARVARARGDETLAQEYFLAAPDVRAVQASIDALARRDPREAYERERTLQTRLSLMRTHPDAVAETRWRMGELANQRAWREIPASRAQGAWLERGMHDFQAAVDLAPLSERYAISAANQAMLLGQLARARALFARAVAVNPGSPDAIAGLGVIAYQTGDFITARRELQRASRIDPNALMVRSLKLDLNHVPASSRK